MTGEIARPKFRAGQSVRVVDDSPFPGAKGQKAKPPFVVGDTVEVARCDSPTTVLIKGDPRLWKSSRFS